MSNTQDLIWFYSRDQKECIVDAPHCDGHQRCVVKEKKQETNKGCKAKMPKYFPCDITYAFCGRLKHYEDDFYHK